MVFGAFGIVDDVDSLQCSEEARLRALACSITAMKDYWGTVGLMRVFFALLGASKSCMTLCSKVLGTLLVRYVFRDADLL